MKLELDWWEYVKKIALSDSYSVIADKVGIDRSAITRWKNGGGVDPIYAVAFARAYGRPVLEALEVLGVLTREEVAQFATTPVSHVSDLSDDDLLAELKRRLKGIRKQKNNLFTLPNKTEKNIALQGVAKTDSGDLNEDSYEV